MNGFQEEKKIQKNALIGKEHGRTTRDMVCPGAEGKG